MLPIEQFLSYILKEELNEVDSMRLNELKTRMIELHRKYVNVTDENEKEKLNKEMQEITFEMQNLLRRKRGEPEREKESPRERQQDYRGQYTSTNYPTYSQIYLFYFLIKLGIYALGPLIKYLWRLYVDKGCKWMQGLELLECRIRGCDKMIKLLTKDLEKMKKKNIPEKQKQIKTVKQEISNWKRKKKIYQEKIVKLQLKEKEMNKIKMTSQYENQIKAAEKEIEELKNKIERS
jgi:hypothetical protein